MQPGPGGMRNGNAGIGRNPNNLAGSTRPPRPGVGAATNPTVAIGPRARNRLALGSAYSGWNNGNVNVFSNRPVYNNRGLGFWSWLPGYGRWGNGYGYGSGYGYSGWNSGYGYGSGYGNNRFGNGQYVWIFIPSLGWVYVPIRLLLMLGL
jgi:hypothetical protein